MGIFNFFSKFIRKLPQDVIVNLSGGGGAGINTIEGISFDVNAVLHNIAQKVYMYGAGSSEKAFASKDEFLEEYNKRAVLSPTELNDMFLTEMVKEFQTIIREKRVLQYVFFMFDGIAPNAKIQQQRSRRFKSAIESANAIEEESSNKPPLGGFSGAFISPGTPFMKSAITYLTQWINVNNSFLPPVIVLSSSDTPGEGEHKIFEMTRRLIKEKTIVQGTNPHVIWSLDSDLAILSCLSEDVKNIFLARQSWFQAINVNKLRKEICKLLKGSSPDSPEDERNLLCDFVIISNLIGNDFVPRSILYPELNENVINAYRISVANQSGYLTAPSPMSNNISSTIVIPNLYKFFWKLSQTEQDSLINVVKKEIEDEGNPQKQRISPTTTLRNAFNVTEDKLNFRKFRQDYYTEIRDLYKQTSINPSVEEINLLELKNSVVENYLFGMEWILKYYTGGGTAINWIYEYPYINAPIPSDIAATLSQMISASSAPATIFLDAYVKNRFKSPEIHFGVTSNDGWGLSRGKTPLTTGMQLLAILPNTVLRLAFKGDRVATKQYLSLTDLAAPPVNGGASLAILSPNTHLKTIKFYSAGKFKEYETVPIIPRFDYFYVRDVINKLDEKEYLELDKKGLEFWEMVNKDVLDERARYEKGGGTDVNIVWEGVGKMPRDLKPKKGKNKDIPPLIKYVNQLHRMESLVIPKTLQKTIEDPKVIKSVLISPSGPKGGDIKDPVIKIKKYIDEDYGLQKLQHLAKEMTIINNEKKECPSDSYNIISRGLMI